MTGAEIAVVLIAVVLASVVKTVTGMGFGLIAIPLISLVAGVEEAVAVTSLANLSINGGLAWFERSSAAATRDLPMLGTTAVLGSVAGTLVLVSVPEEPLLFGLAAVVVAYIVAFVRVPDLSLGAVRSARWSPVAGTAAGLLHGTTGMSGPIVGTWIHAYRLERSAHILSVTSLFLLAGSAQVGVLLLGGSFEGLWLPALLVIVPAVASIPAGRRFRDRVESSTFDLAILVTLGLSAATLVVRAVL